MTFCLVFSVYDMKALLAE